MDPLGSQSNSARRTQSYCAGYVPKIMPPSFPASVESVRPGGFFAALIHADVFSYQRHIVLRLLEPNIL